MSVLFFRHIRSVLFTLAVVWGGTLFLQAQHAGPALETLTVEDGLSQGYANTFFQDREGFIWIGTRNGLNRYDGFRFKVFGYDPLDPYSISSSHINSIQESGDFLLFGTNEGLNLFHKKSQRFYRLHATDDFDRILQHAKFYNISVDEDGRVWCRVYMDKNHPMLVRIKLQMPLSEIKNVTPENLTVSAYKTWDNNGAGINSFKALGSKIWAVSKRQIFSIDTKTERLEYLDVHLPKPFNASDASGGAVWYFAVDGIGRLSGTDWKWWETDFQPRSILFLEDSRTLLVLSDNKVLRFDEQALTKKQIQAADAEILLEAEKGTFIAAFRDRSGLLWFGTNGFGLFKYAATKNRFKIYLGGYSIKVPLAVDRAGHFGYYAPIAKEWIFSSPEHSYNTTSKRFNPFTRLFVDHMGREWLFTPEGKGLMLYCQSGNKGDWEQIGALPGPYKPYFALSADTNGAIWIAFNQSLFKLKSSGQLDGTFGFADKLTNSNRITALQRTQGGVWWIGTDNGLLQAVPEKTGFTFKMFYVKPGNSQGIQNNFITSLLTDPQQDHILWIGTQGGGMSRLDTRRMAFGHFNTRTGFPDNVVYGILADNDGHLWISTNRGLVRFDTKTQALKQYTVEDGLPTDEFNVWAYAKSPDGSLLFGSVKGLVAFNPRNFSDNPVVPRVVFTSLEINNRRVVFGDSTGLLNQAIEFVKEIKIPFAQNSIALEFAALEFTAPTKNRYRYYLKGAEPEWAHTSADHRASYLNLAPGRYTFIVKACNNDGVWSDVPTILTFTVLPPWYRTWWAYLFYAIFLGGGAFLFYRYQVRQQLARAEHLRLKELDAFKSRLFTNITHEFRTPLTVIQGMAGELATYSKEKPGSRFWQASQLIRRNSDALLGLINQLLDLAKLEANAMTLHLTETDLVPFIKYLTGSFESLAGGKDVQVHLFCSIDSIPIAIDKNQVQTILTNLLSNALKFTPANGDIDIRLEKIADWQNQLGPEYFQAVTPAAESSTEWVSIQVRNTGPGIEAAQLPHIFDRFYQADHAESRSGMGSGIGLALVKELVQLMQGALAVKSTPGAETEFVVVLPVVQAPEKDILSDFSITTPTPAPIGMSGAEPLPASMVTPETSGDVPSLLIIEDNADVLHYITACVEGAYQITTAPNGQQGVDQALETVPDIIISDIMMPLKDGFEVVDTLKNDTRTSHIPIVLLTARADLGSRIKGLERGADAYLAKPFDKTELLVQLRNLLELRRKLQARYANGTAISGEQPKTSREVFLEDAFIQKVQAVMEVHMQDEDFDVPGLCKALAMSRTQLHRKMKALTGKSATHYIRSVRLQKARQLLSTTDMTVSEVAFEVGFRNLPYFSTSFTEEFGQPPSSLKK
ncbi:MAG: helix-turn-helix domain-containing protein [Lewinellaceae bacterium]|nr:helix-turn-helix domain-containing protein [Saprospiraceae bacterium]MCB9332177.1 helix-turn-helix domain-containing protein [Lewinellaceae bacterium]